MVENACIPAIDGLTGEPLDERSYGTLDRYLHRAGLQPLDSVPTPSYRFSHIGAWGRVFFVQLRRYDHGIRVRAGRLTQYSPVDTSNIDRPEVTTDQWEEVDRLVEAAGFWDATTPTLEATVQDGAAWYLEGFRPPLYHVHYSFDPTATSPGAKFRRACLAIVEGVRYTKGFDLIR